MPTKRFGKVRRLLKSGRAKVAKRRPFTIQLLYKFTNYTQPIILGIDAGSKRIGISAATKTEELYAVDVELRNVIVRLIVARRECRRARRNKKTRYRKARFRNCKKRDGWLAPSIRQKILCHLKIVENLHKILPILTAIRWRNRWDIIFIRKKYANITGKSIKAKS